MVGLAMALPWEAADWSHTGRVTAVPRSARVVANLKLPRNWQLAIATSIYPGIWNLTRRGASIGQRVGVGFLGGSCGYCEFCRGGDLVNCRNQEYTGIDHDGGYAEVMIAKASGLMSIPNELSSAAAAPLLCAGITTLNATAKRTSEGW